MAKRKQADAIIEDPLSRAWMVCSSPLSHTVPQRHNTLATQNPQEIGHGRSKAHTSFTLRLSESTICPPAAARLLAIIAILVWNSQSDGRRAQTCLAISRSIRGCGPKSR
jgi:hypothetical protein